jgi:hypothetical protein
MTEQQWLTCSDPTAMLAFARFRCGVRRLRLFTVACYRRQWDRLDVGGRAAVRQAEELGEGRERIAARGVRAAKEDADSARHAAWSAVSPSAPERVIQADLLRCIFGLRPFRPPRIDTSWLAWGSGAAVRIARAIYEQHSWSDMPILADALSEAGCGCEDILSHCRGPGPHARGCHVVDALLGKV